MKFICVHRIIGKLGANLENVDFTVEEKPTVFNARFILKITEKQFVTEITFADGSIVSVAEPIVDILDQIGEGRTTERPEEEPEIELQAPPQEVKC